MNSTEQKNKKTIGVAFVLGLPFLYCLSPGPLYWLMDRGLISVQFFGDAVFPLQWLYDNNKLFEAFYDWYIPLWR